MANKYTVDLNDSVKAVLTEFGANILNEQNLEMKRKVSSIAWKTDYKSGDEYETTLWSLINHFGYTCTAGGEKAFKDIEIEFIVTEIKKLQEALDHAISIYEMQSFNRGDEIPEDVWDKTFAEFEDKISEYKKLIEK